MGGGKGPKALGGSPASLWLYVEDCDALFNRAVAAGAKVRPGRWASCTDQFWGDRSGTFTDPHGYTWTIATHKEDLTPRGDEAAPGRVHEAVRGAARSQSVIPNTTVPGTCLAPW